MKKITIKKEREASNRERRVASWVNNLPEGHSAMLPLIVTEIRRKKKAYYEIYLLFFNAAWRRTEIKLVCIKTVSFDIYDCKRTIS